MPLELVRTGEHVALEKIKESHQKVRRETVAQRLDDLLQSMREHGQIHAISLLEDSASGDLFELINGHRRFTAAQRGGLDSLRANIYRVPAGRGQDKELLIQQHLYAANMAEPLLPVERARMFEEVMNAFNWTVEQVADCFEGETPETVAEAMKFLAIDQTVLDVIAAQPEKFSEGHIRVLADYASRDKRGWRMKPDEQLRIAREVAEQQDKLVTADPRKLEARIRSVIKQRRDQERERNNQLKGSSSDPVKALFKAVETVEAAMRSLQGVGIKDIKQIDSGDKGDITKRLYDVVGNIDEFVNERIAKLAISRGGAK